MRACPILLASTPSRGFRFRAPSYTSRAASGCGWEWWGEERRREAIIMEVDGIALTLVYSRSRKLFEAALQSRNPTVISVFSEAAAKCDTSVGFNSLFGPKYYSEEEMALAYLIREIRLCGGLIDGFSMEELDYIAFFVSTVWDISCWFHYTYYTLYLLWHVIHDNNNNVLLYGKHFV